MFGVELGRSVTSEQFILEENTYFPYRHLFIGCNFHGRNDILPAIGTNHTQRQLTAGYDDRFGKIFQQKAQRRCRITHRIRAMQDNETIIAVVLFSD